MNNKRSFSDQLPQFLLLAFAGWWLFNTFLAPKKDSDAPPRPAPTLALAFKGIDPSQGPPIAKAAALTEVKKLQADITQKGDDPLAYWSHLRAGLLHQYVIKDLKSKTRPGGIFGLGAKVTYFPDYIDIIDHPKGDAVEAQAIYQTGDLFWRQGIQKDGKPTQDAASMLESLVHKGRGSSQFLDSLIFVPKQIDPAKVPLDSVPVEGFVQSKVRDLRGTIEAPNPQGIPDRVNQFYSTSNFYKLFDTVVHFYGANPKFSYGLAILTFAICTRFLLQPLTKRQYDSMKGMSLIAPEMKKIQDRYKGNTDSQAQVQMMKEIRALQQRHGVNPMLGCGLAAIQMPIFFLFVYPLIQHYEPKMELVGASFLWISSLARPDIPLLILYGISMFFSFRLSSTPPTDESQRQMQAMMSFIMPVMFPFFISTYPSAFTMYWMTFNAMSTIFQWRMMKAADPKKNVIKTLMGADPKPVETASDAVPERPKGEGNEPKGKGKNAPRTFEAANNGHAVNGQNGNGQNGSAQNGSGKNGVSKNGKVKAEQNGSVMTSLENSSEESEEKDKKKKR